MKNHIRHIILITDGEVSNT